MEIKKILCDKKGSALIGAVVVTLILMICAAAVFEYSRLQIIASGVRDAVNTAATETCAENYYKVYDGVREGYSGGYKLSSGKWSEAIDAGDVYSRLDRLLGTQEQGGYHVKFNGSEEYSLSDLSVQMTNTPFAPDNPENENKLTCKTQINLKVPLSYGWQGLPPMEIKLNVTSGYTPKF